jgi:hypothetical protein
MTKFNTISLVLFGTLSLVSAAVFAQTPLPRQATPNDKDLVPICVKLANGEFVRVEDISQCTKKKGTGVKYVPKATKDELEKLTKRVEELEKKSGVPSETFNKYQEETDKVLKDQGGAINGLQDKIDTLEPKVEKKADMDYLMAIAKANCVPNEQGQYLYVTVNGLHCEARADNSAQALSIANEANRIAKEANAKAGKSGKDGEDGGGYYLSVAPLGGGLGSDVFSYAYLGAETALKFDNMGQTVAFALRGGAQVDLDTSDYPISLSLRGGPNFKIGSPKVRGETGVGITGLSVGKNLNFAATAIDGYFRLGFQPNKVVEVFGQVEAGGVFSNLDPVTGFGGKLGVSFTLVRFQKKGAADENQPAPAKNTTVPDDGPLQRR